MSQLTSTILFEADRDHITTDAALKVFQISELCEMILFYLKPRDRLSAKVAHESFSQSIMGNSQLQKSLFLEADHTPRQWRRSRDPSRDQNSFRLNLFLRSQLAHMGWTFSLDTRKQNSVRLELSAISDREWEEHRKTPRYPVAEFQDMLVSQPPKTVLLDFDIKPHLYVHHEAADGTGQHCTVGWIFSRIEEIEKTKARDGG